MEKRIACIVRWLERCLSEYRAGSLESALMDAECARADLERLRQDVWFSLGRKHSPHFFYRTGFLCRAALSAVLVILATAVPLSVNQPVSLYRDFPVAGTLENLANAERVNILPEVKNAVSHEDNTKESLPFGNTAKSLSSPKKVKNTASVEKKAVPVRPISKEKEPNEVVSTNKTVAYDRVFSLMQTGSRALKKEEPPVRVERLESSKLKGENGI